MRSNLIDMGPADRPVSTDADLREVAANIARYLRHRDCCILLQRTDDGADVLLLGGLHTEETIGIDSYFEEVTNELST